MSRREATSSLHSLIRRADASLPAASIRRATVSLRTRDVLAFLTLIAIPLAVSPVLGDQFTAVKWYVLELLAIVWVLVEAFSCRSAPWPDFVKRHAPALIALALLSLVNGLRSGPAWAVEPLLARATFVALAWCFFAYFTRNGKSTHAIRPALTAALVVVIGLGLAQTLGITRWLGWEPLLGLTSGDGRSATFGNANMAAQFVGLALTLIVAEGAGDARHTGWSRQWLRDALVAAGLAYLYLLGSRSAMLALASALVVVAVRARRNGIRSVLRPVAVAALLGAGAIVATWAVGAGRPSLLGGADGELKSRSVAFRLRVWQRSSDLIRDRPLGAGSANFVHAFLPYQLRDERLRSEAVVYTHPHNELLRALAEEGIFWCALAGYLLIKLTAAVCARARREGWETGGGVLAAGATFLAVECAFQFPFSMAFGSFVAALLLGLALSFVHAGFGEGSSASPTRLWTATRGSAVAFALAAAVVWGRLVVSDYRTIEAPRRACELNRRNLRACLTAAWLDARAGFGNDARVLLADVLERSPYYHPAIKLLAEESLSQGDARAGCFHLWVYDRLFGDRSSEHQRLVEACAGRLLDSFRNEVDVPGYERFPLTVPGPP